MYNQLIIEKSMMVMLTLVMLLSFIAPVMAQENKTAPGGDVPVAPSLGPTDPAEMEAFLDDLLARWSTRCWPGRTATGASPPAPITRW